MKIKIWSQQLNISLILKAAVMTLVWLAPYNWGQKHYWLLQSIILASSLIYVVLFLYNRKLKLSKERKIYVFLLLFGVCRIVSCFLNSQMGPTVSNIIALANLIAMFYFFEYNTRKSVISTYLGCFIVLLFYLLEDIAILSKIGAGDIWKYKLYFTGGKFDVGYNMIVLLFVIFVILSASDNKLIKTRKRNLIYIILPLLLSYMAWNFDCATAVISLFSIPILLILFRKKNIEFQPWTLMIILLLSGFIIFFLGFLLQLNSAEYIITQILERSDNLTGRFSIYYSSLFITILKNSFLFGVGNAGTYSSSLIGYSNLQNGLFQILYLYGIVGLISFLLLNYQIFKSIRESGDNQIVIIFLIAYYIFSIVEISFDYTEYYFFLALSYAYLKNNNLNLSPQKA